ncbi:DUF4118 domain-containing protein [Sphingomonas sp.]|uniref:DUF4118 domain-containing protein n=1 Tax=Sphingomonas sp. TaxID=28214 RepID=UPI0035C84576
MTDRRPSPEALLRAAAAEHRGTLKIFLGAAPGVGKTFEMLREGAERKANGVDVVIGLVETHGRAETEALVAPLEMVPRRVSDHHGHHLEEMNLDAVLARAPALVLVDELAHTNVEGSRHAKRWQDVEELLAAGIDVLTTLNVQHVESLNDVVASFTRVRVRETVPDHVLDGAEIEVVDLPPDELIERLKAGKVYVPAEATRALGHFFSKENLSALREMALRRAAQNVDRSLVAHLDAHAVAGTYAGGERVLVAVSELPGSDAVVRAAKRLADALHAPWQAVHIETPRSAGFTPEQKRRVADALRLAASLGATIASVPAETVVEGLFTHIAGARTTQLVLGRSRRSWWFELRHGSVVDALVRRSEGLAVHVIPAATAAPETRAPLSLGGWRGHTLSAGLVALTTLIAVAVQPWLGTGAIDLLYLLPVILASVRFGHRQGIAAGLLSGLAYNFFFLKPLYTFTIADPRSVLTLAVLLSLAVFVAGLAGRLRIRASIGARSAAENAAVAAFGQALARCSDWQTTGETVSAELSRALDASVLVLAERGGSLARVASCPPDNSPFNPVDAAAAEWAWSRGEVSGRDTGTLTAADWQFHPLATTLGTLAVVAIARPDGGSPVPATRATLLSTLLGQAALAHERLLLEDQLRDIRVLEERDRLRSALLSSIGHDLRTPLTAVAGAIDAVAVRHPEEAAIPLARAELARLRRFLSNLVEMVRFDTGAVSPEIEPTDLTDAVAAAVHDVRDLLPDERVRFRVPPDLPLVPADARLLHHVLLNLLTNAAVHGAGVVTITGERTRDAVRLSVADEGPGLPPGGTDALFEAFARGTGSDETGGSGLGLAIARSFAGAMDVTVVAREGEAGGAVFTLEFVVTPLDRTPA